MACARASADHPRRHRAHRRDEDPGAEAGAGSRRFDAAIGGARRDEEKSRAKERVFSFRSAQHRWDPKNQRPELWNLYNTRVHPKGESVRVFPLSNWTELDVWLYIYRERSGAVPLYFAAERPVVERDGALILVDDERLPLARRNAALRRVRFRTLGCYPLTGAIESDADTLEAVIAEMLVARTSERQGRVIDHDPSARRWRRRSRRVISDDADLPRRTKLRACPCCTRGPSTPADAAVAAYLQQHEHKSAAALHHLRQRRRRQEHVDRPPAARLQAAARRPARGAGSRQPAPRHPGRADRFRAAGRRPAGRARAGHHHRCRLPLLQHRPKRKFIVADCPGHEQYTRNMATGASTADLAIVLVDARKGPADPDPAPQLHRLAAGHPPRGAGGQQDGSGRLRPSVFDADRRRLPRLAERSSASSRSAACRCPRSTATGSRKLRRDALVPGTTLLELLESGRTGSIADDRARGWVCACRCSGSTGRTPTSAAIAGTDRSGIVDAGRWKWWRCPRAGARASRASSAPLAISQAQRPGRRSR
jgi:3'-phosphoadenosine 5'-phosphosulfate sulfotransferase (PAPS reductase)/FAD synthetase